MILTALLACLAVPHVDDACLKLLFNGPGPSVVLIETQRHHKPGPDPDADYFGIPGDTNPMDNGIGEPLFVPTVSNCEAHRPEAAGQRPALCSQSYRTAIGYPG